MVRNAQARCEPALFSSLQYLHIRYTRITIHRTFAYTIQAAEQSLEPHTHALCVTLTRVCMYAGAGRCGVRGAVWGEGGGARAASRVSRGAAQRRRLPEERSVSFITSAQAASFNSWSRYSMAVVFHRQGYLRTLSMKCSMARVRARRPARRRHSVAAAAGRAAD